MGGTAGVDPDSDGEYSSTTGTSNLYQKSKISHEKELNPRTTSASSDRMEMSDEEKDKMSESET